MFLLLSGAVVCPIACAFLIAKYIDFLAGHED